METSKTGYQVQSYDVPVKRYCQTLDLRDSPELIAEYRKRHSQAEAWPEILAGIREVGILEMEIYILGTRLFMIVETPLDFDWDTAMELSLIHIWCAEKTSTKYMNGLLFSKWLVASLFNPAVIIQCSHRQKLKTWKSTY